MAIAMVAPPADPLASPERDLPLRDPRVALERAARAPPASLARDPREVEVATATDMTPLMITLAALVDPPANLERDHPARDPRVAAPRVERDHLAQAHLTDTDTTLTVAHLATAASPARDPAASQERDQVASPERDPVVSLARDPPQVETTDTDMVVTVTATKSEGTSALLQDKYTVSSSLVLMRALCQYKRWRLMCMPAFWNRCPCIYFGDGRAVIFVT
jgi:hypothetical protein